MDDEVSNYDLRAISERRKLFIGSLSFKTTESDLNQAFSRFGEVEQAEIMKFREDGKSRGFGFVIYKKSEPALAAIQAMHNRDFMGRTVKVDLAKSKAQSRADFPQQRRDAPHSSSHGHSSHSSHSRSNHSHHSHSQSYRAPDPEPEEEPYVPGQGKLYKGLPRAYDDPRAQTYPGAPYGTDPMRYGGDPRQVAAKPVDSYGGGGYGYQSQKYDNRAAPASAPVNDGYNSRDAYAPQSQQGYGGSQQSYGGSSYQSYQPQQHSQPDSRSYGAAYGSQTSHQSYGSAPPSRYGQPPAASHYGSY